MSKKQSCLLALPLMIGCLSTHAMPPKPASCPKVSSIKAGGLGYSDLSNDGYVVLQLSQYGTKDTWVFGFSSIKATSKSEALDIGNKALATLSGSPIPLPVPSEDVWACLYQTSQGYTGIAFTPVNLSIKLNSSIMQAIR